MQILIVDDDAVSRLVLNHMLASSGHTVSAAEGVAEALHHLSENTVDAVLCDYEMPEANGLDLLEAMTSTFQEQRKPLFVLVTGIHEESELDDPRVKDVDAYLTKPVTSSMVDGVLAGLSTSTNS